MIESFTIHIVKEKDGEKAIQIEEYRPGDHLSSAIRAKRMKKKVVENHRRARITSQLIDLLEDENPSLTKIRWYNFLFQPRTKNPQENETRMRVEEADILLGQIFNCQPEESIGTLIQSIGQERLVQLFKEQKILQQICQKRQEVDLEKLLALKDELGIPNHKWKYLMDTVQVHGATIGKIKRIQKEWTDTLNPQKTLGERGSEIDILTLLKEMIRLSKDHLSKGKVIRIKFAFDGARITSSKSKKQEIGTMEIIWDGKDLKECKSYKNAHQFIIYLGDEDYQTMQEELERSIPIIHYLNKQKKVRI